MKYSKIKKNNDARKLYEKLGVRGVSDLARESRVNDDLDFLEKFLDKNDKTLDLGCGYGRTAIPFLKRGYGVLGVDITPSFIQEAKRRAKKAGFSGKEFKVGDMVELPYDDKIFDKVFSLWNSFNHILSENNQIRTLNEIYRVLKSHGVGFISTLDGEQKLYLNNKNKITKMNTKGVQSNYFVHDRKHLRRICRKSKFKNFEVVFKYMNSRRRIVVYLYK